MKKVGILCAADTELAPFLPCMEIGRVTEKAMLRFHEGNVKGLPAVAVYSGVCKVNAALAAELLIEIFGVDAVVNAGTAGGMDPKVRLYDTVIAERSFYHDVAGDILTEFHPWMPSVYFPSDGELLSAARNYAETTARPILFGTIATGEIFVGNRDRERILRRCSPLAVDMETAGVAHACYVNGVPFLAVRSITDTGEESGAAAFERNCAKAAEIAAEVTVGLLEAWA
ncbi:MAG: 5'-methylthioadenosine/S-adenosylhomocysteine nucleosidase [Oscillibacter sp.]|nr:5'-methylthioadenosine/S-adenosylhomocysteine nucleosidase [uncultured Oscillibacter sp.]MCI8971211.1 5'-methylthioadenosine/S-adenosylhomocysteine nucleosidase [Oscillibacter sp.]